ncbi:MAG TPA: galactose oxidase early set domain-containing protein [Trebonia sp.]|nr:galactose oxidase early set domain-containing protein [Trebonia sp.]
MRNPLSRGSRRTRSRSRGKAAGPLARKWHQSRPLRAAAGAVALALPVAVVAGSGASAAVNLVVNPGLSPSGSGFPTCFSKSETGANSASFSMTSKAYAGSAAVQLSVSRYTSGEALAMITENQACAPAVTPGDQYNLGVHYMSSTPNAVIEVYRHDVKTGWQFWMDLKNLPAAGTYQDASVRTPTIPAGTNQISFGVALYGTGTVITDNYSMVNSTVAASAVKCTAGLACTKGVWQVLPFPTPVRSIHTILMYNGKVLFVAGSGNDPSEFAAGTFESAVYDPTTGKFQVIPTPDDFFCAGHVQLPDGNVLVLGGNKAYPAADNSHGYEGLNTSYIFDPVTDKYVKQNNLNEGHWYPSATELGNGSVISYGGLSQTSGPAYDIEYYKYAKPLTDSTPSSTGNGEWLPASDINGDNPGNTNFDGFWGLYPAMILLQNGELFYTGSHVFGNNETPVGEGPNADGTGGTPRGQGGAGILNISDILKPGPGTDLTTPVKGLQDTPGGTIKNAKGQVTGSTDMTDQSMSVLLPPAQAQRVFLAGGGNIDYNFPGTRLTDLINLNKSDPAYTDGPLLPRGTLSNGTEEPAADGKMYVSMVLLPNGNVFETGGGLINREDPVYEASMINTSALEAGASASSVYTEMAADPVARTYHSQSFLLPDGRIVSIGNNPGDGSFNMQISVYSPPYLFDGSRPVIKSVANESNWIYGKSYTVKTSSPIKSAELLSPESVTHQSDPNQRFVALPISGSGDTVSLNLTSNANIAPPGWYMLFVTNGNNVPSVAKWVHVG